MSEARDRLFEPHTVRGQVDGYLRVRDMADADWGWLCDGASPVRKFFDYHILHNAVVGPEDLEAAADAAAVASGATYRSSLALHIARKVLEAAGVKVADEVGVLRIDTEGRAYVWNDVDGDQPIADHSTIAILEEAHGKEEE